MTQPALLDTPGGIEYTAVLSADEVYRYELTRTWDHDKDHLGFIMLNPSKADASLDDQTIRRCMFYARRESYGGILVANLYAYRTVSPAVLMRAARDGVDIIGPDNNRAINQVLGEAWDVVVAWGSHRPFTEWREKQVVELLRKNAIRKPLCLGHTQDASPRHPARLGNNVELVPWLVTA